MKRILYIVMIFLYSQLNAEITFNDAITFALNRNTDINNAVIAYKQNNLDQINTVARYIPRIGVGYTKGSINEPNVSQTFSSYPIDSTSLKPYLSFLLPGGGNIKLEYNSDYSESNPTIMPGMSASPESYTRKFMISFSQPLLQNFLLIPYDINIIRMAKHSKKIARFTILQAANNIAFTTALNYINIFINKLNIEVREKSLERAEILLKKNLEKKKLGLVEDTDILGSRASLKKRYSDLIQAQNKVVELKEQLKLLMSIDSNFSISTNIDNIANVKFNDINVDNVITEAFSNRVDLKMLYEQRKIQELNTLNAKSKLLPQLNLIGSYSYYGNAADADTAFETMKSGDNTSWTIGLNLSYPLYPISPISELKKARLELKKIDNNIKKKKLEIAKNIRLKINDIKITLDRLKLLKQTIDYQKNKLQKEEKKYKIGRSSTRVILAYQDEIDSAETEYLMVKFNYYIAVLSLEYEKGTFLKHYYKDYYKKVYDLE